jgi:capsular polysaccharide biosynthesis protein
MNSHHEDYKIMRVSQQLYQLLLAAYPQNHRQEYGAAMTQLFRDQCRDAWRVAHWRGLVMLWLRVVPDIISTSVSEHIANLTGKKFMIKKLFSSARPGAAIGFLITFILVFVAVVVSTTIVTFILPETYSSRTRIIIGRNVTDVVSANGVTMGGYYDPYFIQKEFEFIQSEKVLDPVIEHLDLNESWAKKYHVEAKIRTQDIRPALRQMLELRLVKNTSLIDLTAYSNDRQEAAQIANEIAQEYQLQRKKGLGFTNGSSDAAVIVQIIEHAEPSAVPVRPNKPLNILWGGIIGTILGLLAGGLVSFIIFKIAANEQRTHPAILNT